MTFVEKLYSCSQEHLWSETAGQDLRLEPKYVSLSPVILCLIHTRCQRCYLQKTRLPLPSFPYSTFS